MYLSQKLSQISLFVVILSAVFCFSFFLGQTRFVDAAQLSDWNHDFNDYSSGSLNGQQGWGVEGAESDFVVFNTGYLGKGVHVVDNLESGNEQAYKDIDFNINDGSSVYNLVWYGLVEQVDGVGFDDQQFVAVARASSTDQFDSNNVLCQAGFSQSGGLRLNSTDDIVGTSTSASGILSLQWYKYDLEIDFNESVCYVTVWGVNGPVTIGPADFETVGYDDISVLFLDLRSQSSDGGGESAVDHIYFQQSPGCGSDSPVFGSSTRIIFSDPEVGETLASTTNGYTVALDYYVNPDDFCNVFFIQDY